MTNNPGEGTVTTTPATEAAEGVAVTINITPADGYRAASVAVNGGAVAVVGNAFTMPAEPVTVTVTFEVYDAPDLLIDFETNTTLSGSAYTAGTSLVNNVSFAHQRVLRGSLANDRVHGTYAGRFYPQGGTNGLLATTAAFAEPISKISFWHANYGTDNGTTFKVQVSPDGAAWEDVGAVIDPEGDPERGGVRHECLHLQLGECGPVGDRFVDDQPGVAAGFQGQAEGIRGRGLRPAGRRRPR